ncbi:MAG: hypothetical protein Q8L02_04155 [Candidatus Nitrotoga sp.]|nr:hypothetical protein [Candidatus Nitrotoga sp.]
MADALASIFQKRLPVEVFVMDGGLIDRLVAVIQQWEDKLHGASAAILMPNRRWRSMKESP